MQNQDKKTYVSEVAQTTLMSMIHSYGYFMNMNQIAQAREVEQRIMQSLAETRQ